MAVYAIGYVEYTRVFMTQGTIAAIFLTIALLFCRVFTPGIPWKYSAI
jgi:hypothetical protein